MALSVRKLMTGYFNAAVVHIGVVCVLTSEDTGGHKHIMFGKGPKV